MRNHYGLTHIEMDIIHKIIAKYQTIDFYIFGSRARGDYKKYSDIDIAVKSIIGNEIDFMVFLHIKADFRESTLPYKTDIIDLHDCTEEFYNEVKNDLRKINYLF